MWWFHIIPGMETQIKWKTNCSYDIFPPYSTWGFFIKIWRRFFSNEWVNHSHQPSVIYHDLIPRGLAIFVHRDGHPKWCNEMLLHSKNAQLQLLAREGKEFFGANLGWRGQNTSKKKQQTMGLVYKTHQVCFHHIFSVTCGGHLWDVIGNRGRLTSRGEDGILPKPWFTVGK